ncbi:MAG TPA: GNAT family N-acetyltransferase [Kofleriaceae bacterium]|nr:GNAT family N-acetyltransferase [Kofleriaceae bacterium]
MSGPPPARPTYRVERARPEDVRDVLCGLWDRNLQVDGGVAAKFEWLYRAAPHRPDDVFLLATGAGATVGTAGVAIRAMQLGERDGTAGLLADLAVDKDHRSVGPALALVREVKAWALGHHELAYGFPNKHAEGVFKRAGYQPLGTITRWARVLRHAGFAGRIREVDLTRVPEQARAWIYRAVELPGVAALAGTAVDLAQLARRSPAAAVAARHLRLTSAPAPDPGVDALWARARGEYGVIGHRTREVLAWRFPSGPTLTWVAAHARDGGELRAYAAIERAGDTAHVKDLFGHQPDVLALLDLLPAWAYRTGAHALSMRYLGATWLRDALVERGFKARQSDRLVAVGASDALPADLRAKVLDVGAWHLTDFDEDT